MFKFCRVYKTLKVGFPPVFSTFFIRYDLIIFAFTQIFMRFKTTLWWTNLFLSIPHMPFLNIFFYFIYAVIFLNSFLVLHIFWSIFRCRWSSSLLDLVDLSFHFLCYILLFSSTGVFHSPSNHPLFSGFGLYPTECSAVSTIPSFKCFHSSSTWVTSYTARFFSSFQIIFLVVVGN